MESILVKSFAKINLSLKILGKRNDGFHEIQTIMQNVSLFDEINISISGKGLTIECTDKKVPVDGRNFCYKAAMILAEKYKIEPNIKIHINKNIPTEAGLGGGSSNAAAVVFALNKLWDLDLNTDELASIASMTGSDTAFFLYGGKALCYGRGEIIQKLPPAASAFYIIVKPDISVPTKWAYGEWDKRQDAVRSPQSAGSSENDLQEIVVSKYHEISDIIGELKSSGCHVAQMTGSGSAVFGIVQDIEEGKKILANMRQKYALVYLVETVDKGIEIV